MHLSSHVNIRADFNKLFNKKYMQRIVLSQQSIKKSNSVITPEEALQGSPWRLNKTGLHKIQSHQSSINDMDKI